MSDLSWLNPTPHAIAVYASQPLSPVATQHSLPSGRYSLTWAGLPPAGSHQLAAGALIRSPHQRGRAQLAALLLRLGLRDLRDHLLGDDIAEGIEVLRDRDERPGAANDVVAIVVCKPARRADVAGIEVGLRLAQDDKPVDRDALGDRYIPRHSRLAAGIVVAIPRNIDHPPVRFVGCPIELGHPEVDPSTN